MSERSYSLLEFTLTGRQKHLINTNKEKKFKTRKNQKYIALRQKFFRRKISFCGANVRYTTPLYPTLHPVTPLQNKQN